MAEPRPSAAAPPAAIQDRLSGKVAVVTGGAGAIGLGTAVRLVQEGACVALVDVDPQALAAAQLHVAQSVRPAAEGREERVIAVRADVTADSDVQRCMAEVASKWGRVDCVFANVGVSYASKSILDTTADEYERVMRINVKSAFLTLKHAAAAMCAQSPPGGSIVVTSSIAGLRATPGLSLYSASKFALRGLVQTAAAELGQHGIRVNSVHPSGVDTPMFRLAWSDDKIEELKKGIPLGRVAQVDDVVAAVAWLVSDDAKFVSGAMVKVDGGAVSF